MFLHYVKAKVGIIFNFSKGYFFAKKSQLYEKLGKPGIFTVVHGYNFF